MTTPLIGPDAPFALWAALFAIVLFGIAMEQTAIGKKLTGAVMIILTGMIVANLGIIPTAAPAYDTVWSMGIPMAVSLLLFHADLRRIIRESGRVLVAFGLGTVGTLAGVALGVTLLDLGAREADLAGIFAATYIGGSVNFAAVAEATGFRESASLAAAVAADNIAGTLFLVVLVLLPSIRWVAEKFDDPGDLDEAPVETITEDDPRWGGIVGMAAALCIAFVIVAFSEWFTGLFNAGAYSILLVTAITVGLATGMPKLMGSLKPAFDLGMLTMYLFFVVIGAGADIASMLEQGRILFVFGLIIVTVHLIVILILGKISKLSLPEIMVGSNACILGAATAAAMAGTQGWRALITPAILSGTLGYAIANFLGISLSQLLQ